MKRYLSVLLAAVLCLCLAACGIKPPPATPPVQDPPQDDPPATVYDMTQGSVGVITARDAGNRKYSFTTGFVLTEDGKIVTNYSAVEHCSSAEILLDGRTYAITAVLAWDEAMDLAVLQCDGTDFSALPLSATMPNLGETVYAFGSPAGGIPAFGEGQVTAVAAEGVYHNALGRNHTSGLLLNAAGQVVGIHTASQKEDAPCVTPITRLNTLSYGEPKTLQEIYALDHAAALTALQEWLGGKGKEMNDFMTHQVLGETDAFSVGYSEEEHLLRVEYFHFYESGDTYGFHLELSPKDEQWRYWSDYHFVEGTEVYADGKFSAADFTSQSALTMDSLTMENQRNQLGALNTAAMQSLLRWFHNTVNSAIGGEAADFGFLWHGKA